MSLHAADWKKLISGIAPMLGTALFGPLAGEAINVIGAALLGKPDATQSEVAEFVSAGQFTPAQIVALKQGEQDFKATMKEKDIDLARINAASDAAEMADTANARATFGANTDVFSLAIWILSGFTFLITLVLIGSFLLAAGVVRADPGTLAVATGLIGTIVGVLGTIATQVTMFFFGSSKGSKDAGAQLGATLTEVLKKTGAVAANDESALKGRPARESP